MTTKTQSKFQTVNGRPADLQVKSAHPGTVTIAWDKTVLTLQASDSLGATYSVSGSKVKPRHEVFGTALDDLTAIMTGEDEGEISGARQKAISQAMRWAYVGDYALTEDSFAALSDQVYVTLTSDDN